VGLLDWLAALAGVELSNPMRTAMSSQADQPGGDVGVDPLQPWLLQRPR